ncbi:tape measure protein [Chryseobacterium sp. 1B4]
MRSASKAANEMTKLREVAKLPGLGMEEAVKGSINLESIGFSASNARNILQQFGNAVATVGKGRAEFERAIYGVQQLANTKFPLGEDLNIIKDAVPQVSKLLTEAFGTSRSDDLAKMKITSKQVLDVIVGD